MAPFLKSLLGTGEADEIISQKAEQVLSQIEERRAAMEAATERAEQAAKRLEQLVQPVEDLDKRLSGLGGRLSKAETDLGRMEQIAPQLAATVDQAETLSKGQRRAEAQLSNAAGEIEKIQGDLSELAHKADMALCIKDDLTEFLKLGNPLEELQARTDILRDRLAGIDGGVGEVRSRQEETARVSEQLESRLHVFDERFQEIATGVAAAEGRVVELGRTLSDLSQVAMGTADTKRQLATLQALTDSVGQKIAAIEQQRDAVERAAREAHHLSEAMRSLDIQVRKQEENSGKMKEYQSSVDELRAVHARLLEQTEEIQLRQASIEKTDAAARERFGSLQTELKASSDRLTLERDGFDAVTQRVVDLRRDLSGLEERFNTLETSAASLPELQVKVQELAGHIGKVAGEIEQLDEQAQRAHSLRMNLKRLQTARPGRGSAAWSRFNAAGLRRAQS
jgi:chromosome segregation ATPase